MSLIQIKRSTSNATVTGLSAGELAFTQASNTLFIGAPDGSSGSIPIGTKLNYGTLTANSVLVSNSTSGIDKVIVGNAVITSITANGAGGTTGQILAADAGGNLYWMTAGSIGTNTDAQYVWTNNHTFRATVTFGNTTVNSSIFSNSSGVYFTGNSYNSNNANYLGGSSLSTIQGQITSNAAAAYTNATSYADTAAATAYSNATSYADTKAGTAYSNAVSVASSDASSKAATAYSNATSYADTKAATAYSNATSYADTKAATAYSNATSYADTKAAAAYSNAMSDTLSRNGTYTGNNIFNGTNTVINSNTTLAGVVNFNSTVGTAIVPSGNGTQDLGNTTNRWGVLYLKGSTIVLGNTTLSSTGDALATNNLVVTANATVNNLVGTTTNISSNLSITAANIDATSTYLRVRDVNVSGNLIVSGTLTTIDTNNLQVKDSNIKLADQNSSSDLIDFGVYGQYSNGTTSAYAGIYRDHGGSSFTSPLFKLFASQTEPTSVIDNTAPTYVTGTLQAYLQSGALVSNSTVVNITANSTVSSALVANSLTLTTALAASYGGTGLSSYSAGDILYASGSTTLAKLAVPGSAANGQVLQIVNNLPAYGTLDGGTF